MNQQTNTTTIRHGLGKATLCALALTSTPLLAGEFVEEPVKKAKKKSSTGDWCEWLDNAPGRFYRDKDNPYIQEVRFFGRFQWQYAYVDGEGAIGNPSTLRDFNYDTEEIRRFRLGMSIKFLNFFELEGSANLEDDLAPQGLETDHDIEYNNIYSATLDFDAQGAFGIDFLDSLDLSIGKRKILTSGERAISSRRIKTVERSAISNFVAPENSTGILLSASRGPWDFSIGAFSGDLEREFSEFNGANDYFYTLHLGYKIEEPVYMDRARVDLRLAVNGDDTENASVNLASPGTFNRDWVISLSTTSRKGRFNLLTDFIYGENGEEFSLTNGGNIRRNPEREGSFWGVVILPTYWLVEDRLEAVFRYQYAHASRAEGFRIGPRYSRRAGQAFGFTGPNDLSDGRGDSHQSAYLGLNYYLCKDHAKVMFGVEYDELQSGSTDVYEGYTAWAAFRMYF